MTALIALATIFCWEWLLTTLIVRIPVLRRLILSDPVLLYYDGIFIISKLRRARICRADIMGSMRSSGKANFDNVHALVLETTGKISIVASESGPGNYPVLCDVPGYPPSLQMLLKENCNEKEQRFLRGEVDCRVL